MCNGYNIYVSCRKRCNPQAPPSLETVDNAISGGTSWSKRLKRHFVSEPKKTERAVKDKGKKKKKKKAKDHVYENSLGIQSSQEKEETHVVRIYENATMDIAENNNDYEEPVKNITNDHKYEEPINKITKDQDYNEPVAKIS